MGIALVTLSVWVTVDVALESPGAKARLSPNDAYDVASRQAK